MKARIVLFCLGVPVILAGMVLAQSTGNLDAIGELFKQRLDEVDPGRKIVSACERVAEADQALSEAQIAYLRAGPEQFFEATGRSLDHLNSAGGRLKEASFDQENKPLPQSALALPLVSMRDEPLKSVAELLTEMAAIAFELTAEVTSIVDDPNGFEQLGVVLDKSAELRQACSALAGLAVKTSELQ